jgi:hypothetical protein
MYEAAWLMLVVAGLFLLPELVDWTLDQLVGTLSAALRIRARTLRPRARWWSTILMFLSLYWWSSTMGCLLMPWGPLHWASRSLCGLTALMVVASMMDLRGAALAFAGSRARLIGHPWQK